jgi:ketosteroid isomerase-like protein
MAHPNEELLRSGYEAFGRGDINAVLAIFADDIVWHIPGRSSLAADYKGHQEVLGFFGKLVELSGGTFSIELHDILADDDHGVVLVREKAQRNGKTLEMDSAHIWHIKNGKATEFWGLATDPYTDDEFWS